MKTIERFAAGAFAAAMLLGLGACAGMSAQDKSTAIGAGAGAIGGAVLTGGSTLGTVGGAAVGGVIGHEVSKDKYGCIRASAATLRATTGCSNTWTAAAARLDWRRRPAILVRPCFR